MNIVFRRALPEHKPLIEKWLLEPHVYEFWNDCGIAAEDLILSLDSNSLFHHWLAVCDDVPFGYFLISEIRAEEDSEYAPYCAPSGITRTIDFFIGNTDFVAKGIASHVISQFIQSHLSDSAVLLTDPLERNKRSIHVWKKIGFKEVTSHIPTKGPFKGKPHLLLKKTIS